MIKKLLIANRGEIVCRIARTCQRLGIATATVHSVADRDSLHVRSVGESIEIGPAPSAQSYLDIAAVMAAARAVGADAIHPGIGFLSEEPAFAEAVSNAGLLFIGPSAQLLRRFGDKWAAKREARLAGVPVIGGSEGSSDDPAELARLIERDLQLPVVLKAAAGGGGRGVRIVRELTGLVENIESAMREARASFGRADLIVEEFIPAAHHIEVQVAGDGKGNAIHLFERECSLQRRFQKVVEEAPAACLDPQLRERIVNDAVRLAQSVRYANLGTVEFLVSAGKHHFLECNPRLQVEHTVTEEITGLDLVELQLQIAMEGRLPLAQEQIVSRGHAIQARVYAEDAAAGFAPSTGLLTRVEFPEHDCRVETGVEAGSVISSYYDPMIAKIIVRGADRETALERCALALKQTVIAGVETNIPFLLRLLDDPVVRDGTADNRFIDREIDALTAAAVADRDEVAVAAAMVWANVNPDPGLGLWSPGGELACWSYDDGAPAAGPPALSLVSGDARVWPIVYGRLRGTTLHLLVDGQPVAVDFVRRAARECVVSVDRRVTVARADVHGGAITLHGASGRHLFRVLPFLKLDAASLSLDGKLLAPMMGTILKLRVKVGDRVAKADVLVIEESMKMEMALSASIDGVVTAVRCREGEVVERNQVLIEIQPIQGETE